MQHTKRSAASDCVLHKYPDFLHGADRFGASGSDCTVFQETRDIHPLEWRKRVCHENPTRKESYNAPLSLDYDDDDDDDDDAAAAAAAAAAAIHTTVVLLMLLLLLLLLLFTKTSASLLLCDARPCFDFQLPISPVNP
jgi:hypothetical protein